MSTISTNIMVGSINTQGQARGARHNIGFTLIELLTVIAVIAILAAVLLAAFSGAMEKARQGTAIDHLNRIQNGLAAYALNNNGKYPPVLFAYSDGSSTMTGIKSLPSATAPTYLQGLYPQYINDANVFTDPDNPNFDPNTTAFESATVNTLDSSGDLSPSASPMKFFQADAFDISPEVLGQNDIGPANSFVYVPRYQIAWTSTPMPTGFTVPAGDTAITEFTRQLDQPAATDDTYVTMTTYHTTKANKIIVLFKNGSVKVFDTSQLLSAGCGADGAGISAANGVSSAKFWWIKPNGKCP